MHFVIIFCAIFVNVAGIPKTCEYISRQGWGGQTAEQVDYAIIPVQYVVVHHTVTSACETKDSCSALIRNMQDFHMNELLFHDIGYNFLVGGDGNVYEGAGWHKVGAHTRGYNSRSLGLAFIGDFTNTHPSDKQLHAAKNFLQCALDIGELDKNYKLFGARQVSATQSPGRKLFREIRNWKHFIANP